MSADSFILLARCMTLYHTGAAFDRLCDSLPNFHITDRNSPLQIKWDGLTDDLLFYAPPQHAEETLAMLKKLDASHILTYYPLPEGQVTSSTLLQKRKRSTIEPDKVSPPPPPPEKLLRVALVASETLTLDQLHAVLVNDLNLEDQPDYPLQVTHNGAFLGSMDQLMQRYQVSCPFDRALELAQFLQEHHNSGLEMKVLGFYYRHCAEATKVPPLNTLLYGSVGKDMMEEKESWCRVLLVRSTVMNETGIRRVLSQCLRFPFTVRSLPTNPDNFFLYTPREHASALALTSMEPNFPSTIELRLVYYIDGQGISPMGSHPMNPDIIGYPINSVASDDAAALIIDAEAPSFTPRFNPVINEYEQWRVLKVSSPLAPYAFYDSLKTHLPHWPIQSKYLHTIGSGQPQYIYHLYTQLRYIVVLVQCLTHYHQKKEDDDKGKEKDESWMPKVLGIYYRRNESPWYPGDTMNPDWDMSYLGLPPEEEAAADAFLAQQQEGVVMVPDSSSSSSSSTKPIMPQVFSWFDYKFQYKNQERAAALRAETLVKEEEEANKAIILVTLASDLDDLGIPSFMAKTLPGGPCGWCLQQPSSHKTQSCGHYAFCSDCHLRYMGTHLANVCPARDCLKQGVTWVERIVPVSSTTTQVEKLIPVLPKKKNNNNNNNPELVQEQAKIRKELFEAGIKPRKPDGPGIECAWCFVRKGTSKAMPCEDVAFCHLCLERYLAMPRLARWCPICLMPGTTFEPLGNDDHDEDDLFLSAVEMADKIQREKNSYSIWSDNDDDDDDDGPLDQEEDWAMVEDTDEKGQLAEEYESCSEREEEDIMDIDFYS